MASTDIGPVIYTALRGLVGGRVYPDTFPQDYAWPAIRYGIVSAVPSTTVYGSAGDETTEFRVQIDVVARTDTQRDALRRAVQDAMRDVHPPTTALLWQNRYDNETRAFLATMDYLMHPSTESTET